jgi:hypothetical protein
MSTAVIDHDDLPEPPEGLDVRRPDIPVTINDLAALKGEAVAVVDARVQVLETLRKSSIRATGAEDWLLFRAPAEQGGQVVGYLQDCGAERVRPIWGIEVFNVSKPEKIAGADPSSFTYLISGDGRCSITHQAIEQIEGGRSSGEDFCRGKTGAELELLVRKAARANLDGRITRELAGMKSVPLDEIRAAWVGTPKKVEACRLGRGFGTRDERLGGMSDKAPNVEPPICPHCHAVGQYRPAKGDRGAFYGCPNYAKHPDKKFIEDAAKWIAKADKEMLPYQADTKKAPKQPVAKVERELSADEVFNKQNREPGEEG